eukprot:TRINITY_DN12279_c0_g1_i1.p1 TRINITY_DN12279_c0_g1~~TRINITY_DN12279_c0_g1_i1.p1  ORF type:complete len:562 (+),score=164.73 TRINITY_DN12279_c0_g1_i1:128-1813(+)
MFRRAFGRVCSSSTFRAAAARAPARLAVANRRVVPLLAASAGAASIAAFLWHQPVAFAESKPDEHDAADTEAFDNAGKFVEGLPSYTRADVAKHATKEDRIWVSFRQGVYDITDFVELHPGQDKILLAAGGSIEPFWAMYAQHQHESVVEILEGLRIGNYVRDVNDAARDADPNDPYAHDPDRHPAMVVRSQKPFNSEPPISLLADNMVTPNDLFYIRNHLPVPEIDEKDYVLEITGENLPKPVRLTLNELKYKFPHHTTQATLQCAGNRRNEMNQVRPVRGGSWDIGAISNANWTGVLLRDVLVYAGLDPHGGGMEHIHFWGLDRDFEKHYGASIRASKALDPEGEVLLAFEMNGEPLPKDHGFPLRAIVPGVVGARNVKWLNKIHASKDESPSHWQQNDYKSFGPNTDWANVDFTKAPSIQEPPVQSAITLPRAGTVLDADDKDVFVKGYAFSGGGRGIVRVDVSVDGGQTWHNAELTKPNQKYQHAWAWTLWSVSVPIPEEKIKATGGKFTVMCKAVDDYYNTQPETVESIWNLRGVLTNAWHHVDVSKPVPPSSVAL